MHPAGPFTPHVVYDGDCAFCSSCGRILARWSAGRLVVVPWQRADLSALGLTEQMCRSALQFVDGGSRCSGAAAVAAALMRCREPWRSSGRVLASPAVAPVAERVYRLVAEHRHRLPGGTPACRLPSDVSSVNPRVA